MGSDLLFPLIPLIPLIPRTFSLSYVSYPLTEMRLPIRYFFLLFACWICTGSSTFGQSSSRQIIRSACNIIVDAGPDTNVCDPGGILQLQGDITGNEVFFQWTPSTGLSNPFILHPNANITGPITYTLTGWAPDPDSPELIVNGDFENGNTGFSSDYNYVVDLPGNQTEMFPEGTYSVVDNPNLVHTGFSPCNDHTSMSGDMMVINGAANFEDIWCQTVIVTPGNFYNVSAWVASVNPSSPAQLQFSINGSPIGAIVNAPSTPCLWTPFNATWNSGASTTATICILNLNTALGGNDFAIDDISMISLCSVSDEVEITLYEETAPEPDIDGPAFVCEDDIAIYTASFPPDPPIYEYHWVIPSGASIISGQGTPTITIHWTNDQETAICLEIETRCDMNEACYDVIVGTLPDAPLIAGAGDLCPGGMATLYTAEQGPDDTYAWTLPPNVTLVSGQGTNEIDIEYGAPGEAEICVEITNLCGSSDQCTIISLYPNYNVLFDTIICAGSTFIINGHSYGNGILNGTEFFVTSNGCDSIVEVEVMEATVLQFLVTANLCPGDSLFLDGAFQYQSGTFVDSFLTISNCDSIVITTLIITPFDTTWLYATTCDSTMDGTFITSYAQGNCDSTVVQQITYIAPDTTIFLSASCFAMDTGYTELHLQNLYGCDSIVITDINLLTSDTTRLFYTSCDPADVGIVTTHLFNSSGCDSTVIENTLFSLADTTRIHLIVCNYPDTGTINQLLLNIQGCDSLITTHSVYGGADTTFLNLTTCNPQDSGWQFNTFHNRFGCDSIEALYTMLLHHDSTLVLNTTCITQDTGLFTQLLTNQVGCDSTVVTHVTLEDYNACHLEVIYSITAPLCYGDDVFLEIDILAGEGPFLFQWVHLDMVGEFTLDTLGHYELPWNIPPSVYITLSSANSLSRLDTVDFIYPGQLIIGITSPKEFNGFSVPCFEDSLGTATLEIYQPGTLPTSFEWSNGSPGLIANKLAAGIYSATVTDSHGCTASKTIEITQPPGITFQLGTMDVNCFEGHDGLIRLTSVLGGVSPIQVSLDNLPFENKYLYSGLNAGPHEVMIRDKNGCTIAVATELFEPEPWSIHLGPDTTISYGASILIASSVEGIPQGNLSATWWDNDCANCLSRTLSPQSDLMIKVEAIDENGCTSSDEMKITVTLDRSLFIPNVFSPNGDQVNDVFLISGNPGVSEISKLTIFDRWGNLVFEDAHFPPGDTQHTWDGSHDGKSYNPGVFVYYAEVLYIDGFSEVRSGNVTLIK